MPAPTTHIHRRLAVEVVTEYGTLAELSRRVAQSIADAERRGVCLLAPGALFALAGDRRKRADEDSTLTPMQRAAQHEAAHHIEEVAALLRDLGPVLDAAAELPRRGDWLGEEIDRMARAGIPNLDNAGDGTVDGPGEDDLR